MPRLNTDEKEETTSKKILAVRQYGGAKVGGLLKAEKRGNVRRIILCELFTRKIYGGL